MILIEASNRAWGYPSSLLDIGRMKRIFSAKKMHMPVGAGLSVAARGLAVGVFTRPALYQYVLLTLNIIVSLRRV